MSNYSIPQPDDDSFDEYTLDSFARGWDAQARKLGNKRATVRPPIPGTADYFFRGQSLVQRIMRVIGGREK